MRNILVFVGFVILATTIINCSIVMPDIDLDSNLQVVHQEDLIADKVKGTASKKNVTKTGTSKGVPKSTMIREGKYKYSAIRKMHLDTKDLSNCPHTLDFLVINFSNGRLHGKEMWRRLQCTWCQRYRAL